MLHNFILSKREKYFVYILSVTSLLSVFGNISWGLNAYYAGVICLFLYVLKNRQYQISLFWGLLIWIVISSTANSVYDWRIASFWLLIICVTPAISSEKLYILRKAVMYMMCVFIPFVTIINLYAYSSGINYYLILNEGYNKLQFSGFMTEPLWLGCITGMSNVAITFFFFNQKSERKIIYYGLFILLILSIYLTIVSGSRASLLSSVLGMGIVAFFYVEDKKQFFKYFSAAVLFTVVLMPFFQSGSEVMSQKLETQTFSDNSRSVLWLQRLNEFYSSPIWGIGFATIHRWGRVIVGTVETGSGWLTILSQTGIVGAFFFFLFFRRIKQNLEIVKANKDLILFAGIFVFLIILSFFEGFIYTIGYVPCFMFWLILGIFYECDKFEVLNIEENEELSIDNQR